MNNIVLYILVLSLMLMAFVAGTYSGFFVVNTQKGEGNGPIGEIKTFTNTGGNICYQNGKPVIRLFSTTWSPHYNWIKDTYDKVAKEYMDEGKIVAYHWQLDTGDNTLTPEKEDSVPESEMKIYEQFNPEGSIPTFVFGCKYYRIGTGYERQDDLVAEENEIRTVIESLISS